jgi:hypothetical protein
MICAMVFCVCEIDTLVRNNETSAGGHCSPDQGRLRMVPVHICAWALKLFSRYHRTGECVYIGSMI